MSPYGCPGYPDDGVYYISVHNKWVGDKQAPGVDNIVVNNNKTAFYLRWLHNNPCTYEISLGHHGYSNFVQHDKEWVNVKGQYQQWVLQKVSNNTYRIALQQDTKLVWTDLGPGSPANHQIQLKSLKPNNNVSQLFHISK